MPVTSASKSPPISGWGRYPWQAAQEVFPGSLRDIPALIERPYLPRGQGRSYGDASLPAPGHLALNSSRLDRFISFDPATGVLEAEAGVTLERILQVCLPAGFFLPVTPGTKYVSLGGALASNVHGKNHHRVGSIEHCVEAMEVLTPAGAFRCSSDREPALFRATLGGYGLTGVITAATLRLKPVPSPELDCLRLRARSLEELFRLFEKHDPEYEYSVAWLDTLAGGRGLGRGILMLGNHAPAIAGEKSGPGPRAGRKLRVPFPLPEAFLNGNLLSLFNHTFYRLVKCGKPVREGFEPYFYPLDRIRDWNLLYGSRGFFQYQCVIPDPRGEQGMAACLRFLSGNRLGAFLSVLKRCGDDGVMLPFCRRGYTLALDIPFRGKETLRLLDRLDGIVLEYGGRVYLTKDARLGPETFRAMYPEFKPWMDTVRRFNPEGRSSSLLAERLGLWKE